MARKSCPQCKLVTGASSNKCSRCGHEFAAVTTLPVAARARRCAMCGIVNSAAVTICQCGFDFDMPQEDLRGFYQSRRSNAWVLMIGSACLGVFGTLGLALFMAFSPVIPIKGVVLGFAAILGASAAGCRKALRILSATRYNLDDLDGKGDALPQAKLVEK